MTIIVVTRVNTNMMTITFIQRQSEKGIVVRTRRRERRERSKAQQPGPSGSAVIMIRSYFVIVKARVTSGKSESEVYSLCFSRLVNTFYVQLLHCMMATQEMHDNREEVELKTITCTDRLRSGTIKARKKGGKHSQSTLHQFAD